MMMGVQDRQALLLQLLHRHPLPRPHSRTKVNGFDTTVQRSSSLPTSGVFLFYSVLW